MNALLITTLHRDLAQYPFVQMFPGMEMKVIQARPSEKIVVVQIRAQPYCRSTLHRHEGFTFGLTTKGAWSHNPERFPYEPDSYVCEPVNELHRFHNGPAVTEAFYLIQGDVVHYDEEGREEIRRSSAGSTLSRYLENCEDAGLARPNVLS
jgi:quercetin dioxygenase-like cupin family protein